MTDAVTTDWRNLPAGYPLDRLIAERLGWRVVSHPNRWIEVFLPDGSSAFDSAVYVGQRATWRPDSYLEDCFPRWSHVTDVALTLFGPEWQVSLFREVHPAWLVKVWRRDADPSPVFQAGAKALALAIARAWMEASE